jgi:hypothetical protein
VAPTPDVPTGEDHWVVEVPTYEHSGETVHPDFARAPGWWTSGREFLAITPYPNGNANMENPSLFVRDADARWKVPFGGPNPVVSPGPGYFSDPDIVFDPAARQLRMYYREVDAGSNIIRLVRSADGAHWTGSTEVLRVPDHLAVSPAVVRRESGDWLMWTVNSGAVGCSASATTLELRRSEDGVNWSPPIQSSLSAPKPGFMPWHIDVQWVPSRNEYVALFNAKTAGACGTTVAYLAHSPDGVSWSTDPDPVLVAGDIAELNDIVYRGSFLYEPGASTVTFWMSGARRDGFRWIWSTVAFRRGTDAVQSAALDRQARPIPPSAVLSDPP